MDSLFPLPTGLIAVTGGEGCGKTNVLRCLSGDLPTPQSLADAIWLDLSLPGQDESTPAQVWAALQERCPRWSEGLRHELVTALDLLPHAAKKLYMLSAGSRRKVALVGLLASGAQVTCLDQPYAALDRASVKVIREFLSDMAEHASRSWVVADYEADAQLPWARVISL